MKKFKQYLSEGMGSKHPPHKPERNLQKVISKYRIPSKHGYGNVEYGPDKITIPLPDLPSSGAEQEPNHPNVQKLIKDLKSGKFKDPRMTSWGVTEGYGGTNVNTVSMQFANLLITKNPKKLFHWTKTENVDKILKQGLIPSSGEWEIASGKSSYKAVFMVEKTSALSRNYGFKHYKKGKYTILEIDATGLKLYVDPAYFEPDPISYICFETIPANQIKVK